MEKVKPPGPPPPAEEPARDDVHVAVNLCPFCRSGVAPEEELVVCRGCLTRHHAPCWQEAGRCSSCGVEERLVAPVTSAAAGLPWLGALAVSALGGALAGTAVGLSHNDALLVALPFVSCFLAGAIRPRLRDAWRPPLGFLAAFCVTVGVWLASGSLERLQGFHFLSYVVVVLGLGTLAAALGSQASRRLRHQQD